MYLPCTESLKEDLAISDSVSEDSSSEDMESDEDKQQKQQHYVHPRGKDKQGTWLIEN